MDKLKDVVCQVLKIVNCKKRLLRVVKGRCGIASMLHAKIDSPPNTYFKGAVASEKQAVTKSQTVQVQAIL